jgi:1-acyl-sn-glycerol-3-phosphate acyltransferase
MSGKTTDQELGCLGLIGTSQGFMSRAWRAFTVSFAYVLFALGCAALACTVPWIKLTRKTEAERVEALRRYARTLAQKWQGYCRRVNAIDVRVDNLRTQPLAASGLYVANHPSLVDAIWIIAALPNICCVLKGDLERFWLFRLLATHLDYVSNRDPEQLLAEGTRRLQAGETLLVFPEATRTVHGTLPEFRLGAAEMAIRSQVPVHPIVIHKGDRHLSKGVPWHAFPQECMRWNIVFYDRHPAPATLNPRLARRQLTAELEAFFNRELCRPAVAHRKNHTEN